MAVSFEIYEGVAVLELDRKEAMNALNEDTFKQLSEALDLAVESRCCGIVFLGAGDAAFSAGADISELRKRTPSEHKRNIDLAHSLFQRIYQLPVPSVAVIHGLALGGGLELALACTFRIAAPNARMGLPEVKLGLIPAYGGTQRLARLIGEARALEVILTGRTISSEEALATGLINRVFEESSPLDAGLTYIRAMTVHSGTACTHAMRAVKFGLDTTLSKGLSIEADEFAGCAQSADAQEGIAAFLAKRPPVFQRQEVL